MGVGANWGENSRGWESGRATVRYYGIAGSSEAVPRKRAGSSSPERVDDLALVAGGQHMLGVQAARNDFAVDLDREAALRPLLGLEQGRQGGMVGQRQGLPVADHAPARILADCRGGCIPLGESLFVCVCRSGKQD